MRFPVAKITTGIVIVLGLRQQAFVLFRTGVHFCSTESLSEFFEAETAV